MIHILSHPMYFEGFLEEPLVTQKSLPEYQRLFGLSDLVPLRMKRNRGDIVDQHWHDHNILYDAQIMRWPQITKRDNNHHVLRALNDSTKNLQKILMNTSSDDPSTGQILGDVASATAKGINPYNLQRNSRCSGFS